MAARIKRSQALADRICEQLAAGKSLRKICRTTGMPTMPFVFKWLREDENFVAQYARAREAQAETLFDQIVDIADAADTSSMRGIEHAKIRIDARKWSAGKMAPKKYGDKIGVEHTGSINLATALEAARKRVAP